MTNMRTVLLMLCVVGVSSRLTQQQLAASDHPNIVVILADDLES